jgi:hypothetical protein
VRRWQSSIAPGWNEPEIIDVAHYLNVTYYGFPVTGRQELSQDEKFDQVLPKLMPRNVAKQKGGDHAYQ